MLLKSIDTKKRNEDEFLRIKVKNCIRYYVTRRGSLGGGLFVVSFIIAFKITAEADTRREVKFERGQINLPHTFFPTSAT